MNKNYFYIMKGNWPMMRFGEQENIKITLYYISLEDIKFIVDDRSIRNPTTREGESLDFLLKRLSEQGGDTTKGNIIGTTNPRYLTPLGCSLILNRYDSAENAELLEKIKKGYELKDHESLYRLIWARQDSNLRPSPVLIDL